MPTTPDGLPDLAELDELLALLPQGADSARAQAKLTAASRRFRGAVRHPVSLIENDEIIVDGDGSRVLLLPAAPVLEVVSVTVDGQDVTADVVWSQAGVLRRHTPWPEGPVTIVYTHGHDPIPEEISETVLNMAAYLYSTSPGVSMMQVGSQMTQSSGLLVSANVTDVWDTVVDAYQLNRGESA